MSSVFANEHKIDSSFQQKRIRKTKIMPGELQKDERVAESSECFKICVFLRAIDEVLMQLKERFSDDTLGLLQEMYIFTPARLRSRKKVEQSEIQNICQFYNLDLDIVTKELNEFLLLFFQVGLFNCSLHF